MLCTHALCCKIKCWTGGWEKNSPFLCDSPPPAMSPMDRVGHGGQTNSSQSLWIASAGWGGVGWGGAIETSSWQLLLSLPCYLGLNTLRDPQLGKMVWGSIFLPFRKKASLLSFHAHRSLLLTCICWGMQTTLMSEGVGYLYFNHDREKERLIKGLPWV